MFFKMGEPILSNHYLGKDIFRATIHFSLNKPQTISMEKEGNDMIKIHAKELNTSITNIFARTIKGVRLITIPPPMNDEDSIKLRNWLEQSIKDHLDKKEYKKRTLNISVSKQKRLTLDKWHAIEEMADSAQFWKTRSELFLENGYQVGLDDAVLILEGHTKQGYQIKIYQIACDSSPILRVCDCLYNYDRDNYYDKIFKMMLEYSSVGGIEFY